MSQYECGMTPVGDARQRFSVKFYLVAMLFILFDVEAVFLYPWAMIFKDLKMFGFWEMLVYIGIVLAGFLYIVKKGVIDWNEPHGGEDLAMALDRQSQISKVEGPSRARDAAGRGERLRSKA